ncbi:hypothetical protein TNCV_3653811 [Trichonephila clavipes]|nr:hypothetical protein TNCV_3653811 [Trichonephila clavipes]
MVSATRLKCAETIRVTISLQDPFVEEGKSIKIGAPGGRQPLNPSLATDVKFKRQEDGNTKHHTESQRPPITGSREDRHEQFDDVCSNIDSQLGDYGCSYL